jgi:uncharacterized protein DUF2505
VRFEFRHEFDAPLDVLELAFMSPDVGRMLVERMPSLESVEPRTHDVGASEFRRVWRFQARAPLRILRGYDVTRDMMTWDEHCTYRLGEHSADWWVVPRPEVEPEATWRRRFNAGGTYRLDPLEDGRTRRTVKGDIAIGLALIGSMVERLAVAELRRAYDAEADVLRALCSLG